MTIPESLLDILCCPVSHEPLRPLEKARIKKLNDLIERGGLLYVDGSTVEQPISEALVTRDAKVVYTVEGGIPVLLPDRGIGTTQLESF
ncbi:MAG: Trm112 family protein [Wenzhouxiangellaceae bacterium]